jgi:hypothetical protein
MQTSILVLFFGLGMALVAATSVAIYAVLPASLLKGASRNGRYWGLGTLDQPRGKISGNAPVARLDRLLQQSA